MLDCSFHLHTSDVLYAHAEKSVQYLFRRCGNNKPLRNLFRDKTGLFLQHLFFPTTVILLEKKKKKHLKKERKRKEEKRRVGFPIIDIILLMKAKRRPTFLLTLAFYKHQDLAVSEVMFPVSPVWHLFLSEWTSFFNSFTYQQLLLWGAWKQGLKANIKQPARHRSPIFLCVLLCERPRAIMARSIFQCSEWANLQKEDKEKWVQFLPSEKVCLLDWRIHSRFPGTFDLGLHRKLWDESSTFGRGELMIEEPEVVVASEVKTAAESAVKQACTPVSGLLHDCQFSSVENKNRGTGAWSIIASANRRRDSVIKFAWNQPDETLIIWCFTPKYNSLYITGILPIVLSPAAVFPH